MPVRTLIVPAPAPTTPSPSIAALPLAVAPPFTPSWRYFTTDLVTGRRLIDSLPLSAVTWSSALHAAGSMTATLPLNRQGETRDLLAATLPARTALWIDYGGALMWGGVLWDRPFNEDTDTDTVSITAASMRSYFARRVLRSTMTLGYSQVDQALIAAGLVNSALTLPGPAVNTSTVQLTGVLRDRTFTALSQDINTLLTDLENVQAGADVSFDVAYTNSTAPTVTLTVGYPRGRLPGGTNPLVITDGAVTSLTYTEAGSAMATDCFAIGGTSGTSVLTSQASRPDLIAAGYPTLDVVNSYTSVVDQPTLDSHAVADAVTFGQPVLTATVAVNAHTGSTAVGNFVEGDWVLLAFQPGHPRFPKGTYQWLRVAAFSVAVADSSGRDTLTLTLTATP